MIDTERLISILIDDDVDQLSSLIANVTNRTFQITDNKYKYPYLLKSSKGAPLFSIAAFFGSKKCYDYLVGDETDIPEFMISPLAYACAGGNMYFVHDIFSRFQEKVYNPREIYNLSCGYLSIFFGHFDVVKWLFLKGYEFSNADIREAFKCGYEDIAYFFLENKEAFGNEISHSYLDLVNDTCEGGNEKLLQNLLTKYPHEKFTKKAYQNFINSSISQGNISCVKCLINNSQSFFPRSYGSFIQPSFLYASCHDYLDIIVYLIRLGAKIDDNEAKYSPLILALTSNSYNVSKYYLNCLPKIETDTIIEYINTVFYENYSIEIIQLLLRYIDKTLFDMKEDLTRLAIKYTNCIFFDDLIKNKIPLDFIEIEYLNEYTDYCIYYKLSNLNVHFEFDIKNKVFLNALKHANIRFIDFAFKNGAVLNDEIIEASKCIKYYGPFYKNENLIKELHKAKIDVSKYPDFLINLIRSRGRKVLIYENLALLFLDSAVLTKEALLAAIKAKWLIFFRKAVEIQYFQIDVDDIPLDELNCNIFCFEQILEIIFDKQPSLVDQLINKIDRLHIDNNVTQYIKSCRPANDDILSIDIDTSYNSDDIIIVYDFEDI